MYRAFVAIVIVLVSLHSTGCYYAFGTRPAPPSSPSDRCTTSRVLPIVDAVLAGEGALGLALGGYGLVAVRDDGSLPAGEAKATSALLVVVGGALLIANGLSAYAGFRGTATCRERQVRVARVR